MNGINDDVRLPFSVLDPIVGDVFSVLWEPEMIRETGSALKILTGEVLSQIGMTVLQATVMTGLMSALQWPLSTPLPPGSFRSCFNTLFSQFSQNWDILLTILGAML